MCLNVKKIKKNGEYFDSNPMHNQGEQYEVDTYQKCGVCIECMNEKAIAWSIRNHWESQDIEKKCFITLTYNTQNMQKNKNLLIYRDFQLWLKRFRFAIAPTKIRYYYAGEYGTKNGRAHWHVIIYGWEGEKWKVVDVSKSGFYVYREKTVQKTWDKGWTYIQEFNPNEIPYIALYLSANAEAKEKFAKDDWLLEKARKANNYTEQKYYEKLAKKGSWTEMKERCGGSLALGFDKWIKQYPNKCQTWEEFVGEKCFLTPTPWIKKTMNMGLKQSVDELIRRREFEEIREQTLEERKTEKKYKSNKLAENARKKWAEQESRTSDL